MVWQVRIQCCHCYGMGSIPGPGLGTSKRYGHGQKKKNKQKKKQKTVKTSPRGQAHNDVSLFCTTTVQYLIILLSSVYESMCSFFEDKNCILNINFDSRCQTLRKEIREFPDGLAVREFSVVITVARV